MTSSLGCASPNNATSGTTTITIATGLSVTATSTADTTGSPCSGTATATVSDGTSPYSYLWNNSQTNITATGLCAGTYTVTVTDANNCTGSNTITVITDISGCSSDPSADFGASQTSGDAGFLVDFFDFSSNSPTSWLWTFYGGTPQTSTLQNPDSIKYCQSGTYSVKLVATNTCGNDIEIKSGFITVSGSCSTGIFEPNIENNISIFPNPTTGSFTISIDDNGTEKIQLNIFNVLGEKVYTSIFLTKSGKYSKEIKLDNILDGVYFVQIKINTKTYSQKLVIQRQ